MREVILRAKPYYSIYWFDLALIDVFKNRKRIDTIVIEYPTPVLLAKAKAADYLAKKFREDQEREDTPV